MSDNSDHDKYAEEGDPRRVLRWYRTTRLDSAGLGRGVVVGGSWCRFLSEMPWTIRGKNGRALSSLQ